MNKYKLFLVIAMICQYSTAMSSSLNTSCSDIEWRVSSNPKRLITYNKDTLLLPVEITFKEPLINNCIQGIIIDGEQRIYFKSHNNIFLSQIYNEDLQPFENKGNNQTFTTINKNRASNSKKYTIWLSVPYAIDIKPGRYLSNLKLGLATKHEGKNIRNHEVQYNIEPSAKIKLLDNSKQTKKINFKPFTQGTSIDIPLDISTNTRLELNIESKKGALTHTKYSENIVHYSVSIDTLKFKPNLSNKNKNIKNFIINSEKNKRINMSLKIEDTTASKLSGLYTDTLTISVRPKL
ncbi:hypothetical protein [Photobacterium minamisatsumaniensis]|uniref:hypothetical protein n=1 Tax=Photobacterium minamisatsumaniensis TaxID=2910233 RepID=UPI003D0A36A0